jgi:hypothetical protein
MSLLFLPFHSANTVPGPYYTKQLYERTRAFRPRSNSDIEIGYSCANSWTAARNPPADACVSSAAGFRPPSSDRVSQPRSTLGLSPHVLRRRAGVGRRRRGRWRGRGRVGVVRHDAVGHADMERVGTGRRGSQCESGHQQADERSRANLDQRTPVRLSDEDGHDAGVAGRTPRTGVSQKGAGYSRSVAQ